VLADNGSGAPVETGLHTSESSPSPGGVRGGRPQVAGYVAVPIDVDETESHLAGWRAILAADCRLRGYELGPVFHDTVDRSESGLYALAEYLRRHGAAGVLTPSFSHLTHGLALAGADRHAAERWLLAPVYFVTRYQTHPRPPSTIYHRHDAGQWQRKSSPPG